MELTGQVLWRCTVQTTIRKNGKMEVDLFRNAQPVELSKKRRDMVPLPCPVDESGCGI